MKTQVLLAVLSYLAVSTTAAVIEPQQQISPVMVVESAGEAEVTVVTLEPIVVSQSDIKAVPSGLSIVGNRNLNIGAVQPGDRLLLRQHIVRTTEIPGAIQVQDFSFTGGPNTIVSALFANEVGNTGATATLISGGLNTNSVGVRMTSAVGHGFYFIIDIHGSG